jgi:hypothetical protein
VPHAKTANKSNVAPDDSFIDGLILTASVAAPESGAVGVLAILILGSIGSVGAAHIRVAASLFQFPFDSGKLMFRSECGNPLLAGQ